MCRLGGKSIVNERVLYNAYDQASRPHPLCKLYGCLISGFVEGLINRSKKWNIHLFCVSMNCKSFRVCCQNKWRIVRAVRLNSRQHMQNIYIYISGGPLSALTCCVNVRLLSAIKKISPLIYSQSWVAILRKLWWLSPWYFSADVYLAELHCRGRERVFELEARSPWWTDC